MESVAAVFRLFRSGDIPSHRDCTKVKLEEGLEERMKNWRKEGRIGGKEEGLEERIVHNVIIFRV